eukprot:250792_1
MLALTKVDQLISFIDETLTRDEFEAKRTEPLNIDSICVYPIKSCAPIIMDQKDESYPFSDQGLKYDRSWMVIDANTNKKITQRQYPRLALIKPSITKTDLIININNKQCTISLTAEDGDCGDEVAQLFTDFIGIKCRLKKNVSKIQSWDSHPLLIVFKESIEGLNEKILNKKNELKYDYLRFRPNVLLSGVRPFEEEGIKFLKLDEATFICDRNVWHDGCLNVTCIDYNTGEIDDDNQPKETLKNWKSALFGLGLRTPSGKNSGVLRAGDKVIAMW